MSIHIDTQAVLDKIDSVLAEDTVSTSDYIIFTDADGSGVAKRESVSDLLGLVPGGSGEATTWGTTFPSNPEPQDNFIFSAAVATGGGVLSWKNTDGSTDIDYASIFDWAKYDGTNWVKQGSFAETFISALNNLTTATPATDDVLPFVDISDSNGNRKATIATIFDLQSAYDTVWLTSADFADGDLAATGTLEWTADSGAPTQAVDGSNTQCKLPKSHENPNNRIMGLWFLLRDGDDSDNIKGRKFLPWLDTSPDAFYRMYVDNNTYVEFTVENGDTDEITPIVTVTAEQDSSNNLTGMYLTVSPAVIG